MYEIGDKVIYQGADKKAYKKHGVVKSIEDKDGKPQLTVELDGGETFTAPIDDWSREFSNACTSTNSVVRNAMAVAAKNAATVTISPGYAARVQHAMRDLAHSLGVRISGTNTLACSDEDEAEDVVEMLVKEYKVPKDEVWINSRKMAKNAIDLGRGIILKSKEAEEVQRLLKTKGYDAAKKYCQEKKEAIKAVDGHRGWYFLDAALDAGKWAGVYNSKRVVANAMAARNAGTIFGEDLDEVSAKLEKCVKGLRGVLEKLRPIWSERNRYIAEGNKFVFASAPQGDKTSVNRYKKLLEEFSDLASYTRG